MYFLQSRTSSSISFHTRGKKVARRSILRLSASNSLTCLASSHVIRRQEVVKPREVVNMLRLVKCSFARNPTLNAASLLLTDSSAGDVSLARCTVHAVIYSEQQMWIWFLYHIRRVKKQKKQIKNFDQSRFWLTSFAILINTCGTFNLGLLSIIF